jgi:hypothetical protein
MLAYLKQRVLSFEILDQYRDKYFKINAKIINLFLKCGNKKLTDAALQLHPRSQSIP